MRIVLATTLIVVMTSNLTQLISSNKLGFEKMQDNEMTCLIINVNDHVLHEHLNAHAYGHECVRVLDADAYVRQFEVQLLEILLVDEHPRGDDHKRFQ